eukprot:1136333-Pelagomonas_calceolata.AAC.1
MSEGISIQTPEAANKGAQEEPRQTWGRAALAPGRAAGKQPFHHTPPLKRAPECPVPFLIVRGRHPFGHEQTHTGAYSLMLRGNTADSPAWQQGERPVSNPACIGQDARTMCPTLFRGRSGYRKVVFQASQASVALQGFTTFEVSFVRASS